VIISSSSQLMVKEIDPKDINISMKKKYLCFLLYGNPVVDILCQQQMKPRSAWRIHRRKKTFWKIHSLPIFFMSSLLLLLLINQKQTEKFEWPMRTHFS